VALIGPDTWGKGSWLTRREGADVPEWSIAVVIDAEGRLVREIGEQIVAVAYQLDNLVTQVRTMKTDGRGWVTGKQTNSSLEVTVSLTTPRPDSPRQWLAGHFDILAILPGRPPRALFPISATPHRLDPRQ
jgi:hypothetical protein